MKSTDLLIQEHKQILRALDVLDAVCTSARSSGGVNEGDLNTLLDFLRWFADAHHQVKEETILFPALKKAAACQNRPVEHMLIEHDQERSTMEQIETDVRMAKTGQFAADANRLSSNLRTHIYKEDRILFETADSVISAEEDSNLFARLTAFETAFDRQVLQEKLKQLHSLELKYLRHSA